MSSVSVNKKRRKKKAPKKLKKILFGGLFFIVTGGLVYGFLFSGILSVKEISVDLKNPEYVNKAEIEQKVKSKMNDHWIYNLAFVGEYVSESNLILVSSRQIEQAVSGSFSEVKEAKVEKDLIDRSLKIKIIERSKFGLFCGADYKETVIDPNATGTDEMINATSSQALNNTSHTTSTATSTRTVLERRVNQCFYLSDEGVVYKKSPHLKGGLAINLYGADSFRLRDRVVSQEVMDFIKSIKQEFKNVKIIAFDLISRENLRAETFEGWYVYFNPTYDLNSQIENLWLLLEKKIDDTSKLNYIDLRVEGRAYYR